MSAKDALYNIAQTLALHRLSLFNNDANNIISEKFLHSAIIFQGKKPRFNENIALGNNNYKIDGSCIHAEEDACDNLKTKPRQRTLEPVNLLVIRISTTGKIMSSLPCIHCRKTMAQFPMQKGYKIIRVYYSTSTGDIEFKTLTHLLEMDENYMTSFYRHSGYDIKKWQKWRDSFLGKSKQIIILEINITI